MAMKPGAPLLRSARLLDRLRERIRYKHYSLRTEESYLYWARFFIRWHRLRHPRDMGAPEIEAFLAMLATERHVSAATHNQALSALLFLYREVLDIDVPWLAGINRPSSPKRIPSVLTQSEVAAVLDRLAPDIALLGRLLYGTGMRLMEGLRLRIKDVDFDRRVIVVREGKGGKDRVVMLPRTLEADLKLQVKAARCQWEVDRQAQRCGVDVPHALASKYPDVGNRWGWFWLFPSPTLSTDPRSGTWRRHHLFEERLQRGLKRAVAAAGIAKPVSVHTLRTHTKSIFTKLGVNNRRAAVRVADDLGLFDRTPLA